MAKHALLELATVPRDRHQLQSLINEARAARRRARIMYAVAAVAFCAALFVLWSWSSSRSAASGGTPVPAAVIEQAGTRLYLPIAIR